METPTGTLECAVCLQTCVYPAQLPCGHIFCFLCIKGVASQSKRCAMCRRKIPANFLDNPKLLNSLEDGPALEQELDNEYQWFYEGRNGWWKYDARTSKELDSAYQNGKTPYELLIAGFLYTVDFETMFQSRRNDPSRKRRIKRDIVSVPAKGIAGIKFKNQNEVDHSKTPETDVVDDVILFPPSNTPTSAAHSGTATPNTSESLNRHTNQMSNLNIRAVMELMGVNDNNENIRDVNVDGDFTSN